MFGGRFEVVASGICLETSNLVWIREEVLVIVRTCVAAARADLFVCVAHFSQVGGLGTDSVVLA